jgi:tRNA threonylcarbamoyladenosine biosynthesis protein TsaE
MNLLKNNVTLVGLQAIAVCCARHLPEDATICFHVNGIMGAGKTTFIQYLLTALGVSGPITSPTFSIMEEHISNIGLVLHMDLYRVHTVADLESLGVVDVWGDYSVICIEWANNDPGYFPPADFHIELNPNKLTDSRSVRIQGVSNRGNQLLKLMDE